MTKKQIHIMFDSLSNSIQELLEYKVDQTKMSLNAAAKQLLEDSAKAQAGELSILKSKIESLKVQLKKAETTADIYRNHNLKITERLVDSASVTISQHMLPQMPLSTPKEIQVSREMTEYKGYQIRRLLPFKDVLLRDLYPEDFKALKNIKDPEEKKKNTIVPRILDIADKVKEQNIFRDIPLREFTLQTTIDFINSSPIIIYLEDIQGVILAIKESIENYEKRMAESKADMTGVNEKKKVLDSINEFLCEYTFNASAFKYKWEIPFPNMKFEWEKIYTARFS